MVAVAGVVEPADYADAVVIMGGQVDILGRGGLRSKNRLGREAGALQSHTGPFEAS
jgi:hypothetical protein